MMKLCLKWFYVGMVVVLIVLTWQRLVYFADTLPAFYSDEIANNQMAVSFWSKGDYWSDLYHRVFSSGFIVTWPGALGWAIGDNLFFARLFCVAASWILSIILGYLFLRRANFSKTDSFAISVFAWTLLITAPFALPYWFGFIYNLGELNSFLLIGVGYLLFARFPFWAVFIFGLAVWHGKFLYVFLVWAILLGDLFSKGLSIKQFFIRVVQYAFVFILPLVLWMVWLALKFDLNVLKEWISAMTTWFGALSGKQAPIKSASFTIEALSQRLSSPVLEWVGYSLGTKLKTLVFSLGAVIFTWISLLLLKNKIKVSKQEMLVSLAASFAIIVYSFMYFFTHPYMWSRHFHQALFSGIILWVFWGYQWAKAYSLNVKPVYYGMFLILIVLLGVQNFKNPIDFSQITYARTCTDLFSVKCDPILYQ